MDVEHDCAKHAARGSSIFFRERMRQDSIKGYVLTECVVEVSKPERRWP